MQGDQVSYRHQKELNWVFQKILVLEKMGNLGPIWAQNCVNLYLRIRSKDFFEIWHGDGALSIQINDTFEFSEKIHIFEQMGNFLGPIWAQNCVKLYLQIRSKDFFEIWHDDGAL